MSQRVVVAAFIHRDQQVFVAKRSGEKCVAPGRYHLPGGHVEFSEDAPTALAREFKEEFGVEICVGDPLHVFSYVTSDGVHTIGIVFFASMLDDEERIRFNPEDNESVLWVSFDEIGSILPQEDDHNYRAVLLGRQRLFGVGADRRAANDENDLMLRGAGHSGRDRHLAPAFGCSCLDQLPQLGRPGRLRAE